VYKNKSIVGIIPARGGSKGLPRKNVLLFSGKPLIAWSIEQAILSGIFDSIIVNTDDEEIATIAHEYGAEVPFMRPKELAADNVNVMYVILFVLQKLASEGVSFDVSVLLQPTSPLRTADDIIKALEIFFQKNAQAVVSVCEVEHSPFLMNMLPLDGCMNNFIRDEMINKNRQDFPKYYRLNGSIYVADVNFLYAENTFFGKRTYAYVMPQERSIDIDTQTDFQIAEFLHSKLSIA